MAWWLALAGCTVEERADACGDPESTSRYVVTELLFARSVEGVSTGFDLDGVENQCGVPDLVSPEGATGIDNAFANLIPALELTEAVAGEGLIQDAINEGDLLLVFEMAGVDDPMNDTCVDLSMKRALGVPNLGSDDRIESGQTFDLDPNGEQSLLGHVSIEDGYVHGDGLELSLDVDFFDKEVVFPIHNGQVDLFLDERGLAHGTFAGGTDAEALIALAGTEDVDPALVPLVEGLLATNADLVPGPDGTCTQLSVTLDFQASVAFFYDE